MSRMNSGRMPLVAAVLVMIGSSAFSASAQDSVATTPDPPAWKRALDNDYYKIGLNVRTRMELANFENFSDSSQAWTTRLRAGIGSKPFYGLSGLAELESSWAYDNGGYWDVVTTPNRKMQTPIADPPKTDLNQLYLRYQNAELFGMDAIAGRQRIILDDQRFVGNVGWRQNEQTFDAARGGTTLGVDGLELSYGYLRKVHRIFGNKGGPATRDWSSDSHFVHASYSGFEPARITAFAYLFDFKSDSPVNSANSYGLRVDGATPINEEWKVGYAASYAWQEDAGRNPVNYQADYVAAEGSVGWTFLGGVGTGYELMGSDAGKARFVTPLATAHKFNGFADVFLNNGGPGGLQDFYAFIAPNLPLGLEGKFIYHHFWADDNGTVLGEEYDFVLTRQITSYLSVLTKGALFESKAKPLADGWRYWLEFTVSY